MRPVREARSKVQFKGKWLHRNQARKSSRTKELKITRHQRLRRWARQTESPCSLSLKKVVAQGS